MPRLPMIPELQNSTSIGVPFNCFARPAICAASVTSRRYRAFAPRSVPITCQPSSAYCRASSSPRPLPAPVTRIVGMDVAQIDGEVGGRRARRDLVEEIRDEAAMVSGVVDQVHQDLEPRHAAFAAADEGELHDFVELLFSHPLAPGDGPGVDFLLRAPQLVERRMVLRVAGAVAVRPSFEVRLE